MNKSSESASARCSIKCEEQFRSCLAAGEDESVCRMKRVPCDCSCSER